MRQGLLLTIMLHQLHQPVALMSTIWCQGIRALMRMQPQHLPMHAFLQSGDAGTHLGPAEKLGMSRALNWYLGSSSLGCSMMDQESACSC